VATIAMIIIKRLCSPNK